MSASNNLIIMSRLYIRPLQKKFLGEIFFYFFREINGCYWNRAISKEIESQTTRFDLSRIYDKTNSTSSFTLTSTMVSSLLTLSSHAVMLVTLLCDINYVVDDIFKVETFSNRSWRFGPIWNNVWWCWINNNFSWYKYWW